MSSLTEAEPEVLLHAGTVRMKQSTLKRVHNWYHFLASIEQFHVTSFPVHVRFMVAISLHNYLWNVPRENSLVLGSRWGFSKKINWQKSLIFKVIIQKQNNNIQWLIINSKTNNSIKVGVARFHTHTQIFDCRQKILNFATKINLRKNLRKVLKF